MDESPLDSPVWAALTSTHAGFAQGDGDARRYPPEVTPMVGLRRADAGAYADLAALVDPGAMAPLFLATEEAPPFPVVYARDIAQMIHRAGLAPPKPELVGLMAPLGPEDVADMLALVELTKPGPFGPRTIELGDYLGIRNGGRLVAMAGVRLRPAGFSEISGVCVHPDWQGRGYGRAITESVGAIVASRSEVAFLHVKTDNAAARRAYLGLGFEDRRTVHLRVVKLPG